MTPYSITLLLSGLVLATVALVVLRLDELKDKAHTKRKLDQFL